MRSVSFLVVVDGTEKTLTLFDSGNPFGGRPPLGCKRQSYQPRRGGNARRVLDSSAPRDRLNMSLVLSNHPKHRVSPSNCAAKLHAAGQSPKRQYLRGRVEGGASPQRVRGICKKNENLKLAWPGAS